MAVAAEVLPGGELKLAGLGVAPTHRTWKRGVVVNIDATVQAIQQALKEAEMMAACRSIAHVHTGITGSHIRGQNSTGMVIARQGGHGGRRAPRRRDRPRRSTSPAISACCSSSRRSS